MKLAGQGNLIPVTTRILADIETPLSAYRKIRGQGESFLFESVKAASISGATRSSVVIHARSSSRRAIVWT